MAVAAEVEPEGRIRPGASAQSDVSPPIALVDPTLASASAADLVAANQDLALVAYLADDRIVEARQCIDGRLPGRAVKMQQPRYAACCLHLVAQGGAYMDAPFAAGAATSVSVTPTLSGPRDQGPARPCAGDERKGNRSGPAPVGQDSGNLQGARGNQAEPARAAVRLWTSCCATA